MNEDQKERQDAANRLSEGENQVSQPKELTKTEEAEISLPLSARREQGGFPGEETGQGYIPPPPPEPDWKAIPTAAGFSARALTEGAMMIAIALLLAFLGNYVPVLNFLGQLLFPLPIAILVFRRGLQVGMVATVALFGLSLTFLPIAQAVYMIVQYGLLGLFLGYCYRNGRKPLFTLGIATMIAAAGAMISLVLTLFISGLPISSLLAQADAMVAEMMQMMKETGSLDAALAARNISMAEFTADAQAFVRKLLPAAMILSAMFMTLICYLVSAKVLRRLRYPIPQLPPFTAWRMDWRLTWGLILGLFLGWFGRQFGLAWMESLGDNISYVFGGVILVCGISLVLWLLKHSNLNIIFKALIVVVVLQFFSIAIYLVVLLAVFDALRDLRPWFTARIDKSQRFRKKD